MLEHSGRHTSVQTSLLTGMGRQHHELAESEKDTDTTRPSRVYRVARKEQRRVTESRKKRPNREPVDQCSVFETINSQSHFARSREL